MALNVQAKRRCGPPRTNDSFFVAGRNGASIYGKECQQKNTSHPPRMPWRFLAFGHTFTLGNQELTATPSLVSSSSALVHVPSIYVSSLRAMANSGIHGRGLATLLASAHR
jgi:hypothetical protein